jgi:hypothetical protein
VSAIDFQKVRLKSPTIGAQMAPLPREPFDETRWE